MIIHDVRDNLEIPNEGILSKVLYRDDSIRVVGFAFDTDQELTEHTAGRPIVVQVISGRVRFSAEGVDTELGSEGWLHLEASIPHSVLALEPSRLLLTLL